MSLRKKTLLIIGVTLAGLVGLLYFISQTILLGSFAELEAQNVRQNVERAAIALQDKLIALNRIAGDWAQWDDTYNFIQDHNEAYIQSNISNSTLLNLKLNLMLFFDASGRLVYGKALDLQNETEAAVPQNLLDHLADQDLILRHTDPNSSINGLIQLPDERVLLFSSQPIVTSDQQGPIRGTLILGRYLDDAEIETLAETTRLPISVGRLNDSSPLPVDFQTARVNLTPDTSILSSP